jgi:uncharacterized protein YndB with AHSA1/START domain
MPEITVTVVSDIPASPAEVFAVIADFEQGPRWQPNMRSARWTSPPPAGVGATFEQTARFLGRDMTSGYEVTEYDPPRVVGIRSTTGPFPISVRRVVESHGDGARITEVSSGRPTGIARLLSPFMKPILRRTIARDYRHLAQLLDRHR